MVARLCSVCLAILQWQFINECTRHGISSLQAFELHMQELGTMLIEAAIMIYYSIL